MSKYTTNEEESQCLPNRLGLTRPGEIAEAEFEGFLLAEIMLTETLTTATRFDCQYIRNIHTGSERTLHLCRKIPDGQYVERRIPLPFCSVYTTEHAIF